MKKNLAVLLSTGLLIVSLFPMLAVAQGAGPEPVPPVNDIWKVIDTATQWLFGFFVALVVIMVIYAGFMFVTAAGDTDKVNKAREALTYAVVGALVALLSRAVVPVAKTILGITS